MGESAFGRPESLASLLGGRRGALDATIPPLAFGVAWWLSGESVGIGVSVAVALSAVIAVWRLKRGDKPRSILVGLAGVCLAGIVALYTGRAEDFFLLRILSNAGSLLAWAISIVVRWPLLGVVVGLVLGQRTRWRRDPVLLRAYGRASWIWVAQYAVRILVFIPLWLLGLTGALAFAQAALTWPLVALCLAVSWWVLRRNLPTDHPGLRHPAGEQPSRSP
ncbi:MAG: DUF3159 domain-containing protein [Stackebrandtia sp.]